MWINLQPDELKVIDNALHRLMASTAHDEAKAVRERLAEFEKWKRPEDGQIITRARELYADDETEIDDDPAVSHADDGTWVAAWVWVSNEEAGLIDNEDGDDPEEETCRTCGETYNGYGDGYDGECPDCADKTDQKENPENYQ